MGEVSDVLLNIEHAVTRARRAAVDEAVVAGSGWPRSMVQGDRELVARLTDLNHQTSSGAKRATQPSPGAPLCPGRRPTR